MDEIQKEEWLKNFEELQNEMQVIFTGKDFCLIIAVYTHILWEFLSDHDIEYRKIVIDKINSIFNKSLETIKETIN